MKTQGQSYLANSVNAFTTFKKYLIYSLVFHAVVLLVFTFWGSRLKPRKIPETKITMVNLGPVKLGTRQGSTAAPAGTQTKPGEGNMATPNIPQTKSMPVPKIPPAPAKPQVKVEPKVKQEVKPKAPVQKNVPAKTPQKPGTQVVQKKAPATPKVPKKEKPPAVNTTKTPSPDSAEIASALAGINQELTNREQTLKQSQNSGEGPGGGTGAGQVPALGSEGGSITARDPGYAQYQSNVRSKIIRSWVKTHTTSEEQRLIARVRVQINSAGTVISKALVKGSGDAAFDQSALRAVESASPFPAPPGGIQAEALSEGFIVDFRSRVIK